MDAQAWTLVSTLVSAGAGATFGAILQSRSHRTSAWYSGHAELQRARRDAYAALLEASNDFISANELRTWRPGWQSKPVGEPDADDLASFDAVTRAHRALDQVMLISPADTWGAGDAFFNKVQDLVEAGHLVLGTDDPLRAERANLRREFVDLARRDLNVAPIGYSLDNLNWLELQMLRLPGLRRLANRRAFGPMPAPDATSTDSQPVRDPSTS